jgi:nucleotide-binding universal stress UspA family protein
VTLQRDRTENQPSPTVDGETPPAHRTNPEILNGEDNMHEVIVGVDSSPTARAAAQRAAELATAFNKPLHIVMALDSGSVEGVRGGGSERFRVDLLTAAEQSLLALADDLHMTTPVTTAVVVNDPAKALCEQARLLDASAIVVGNKRVQGPSRVLGSIAGDIAKRAHCDVYIVHTHERS